MAELYLLPENVSAAHAAQVLEFLNAAASAEEIAAAVEIPEELDIGLRVAARILARRDQLGGFTSLEQVYAVPYVGPERFTELVTSLSAARPPQLFDEQLDRGLLAQIVQRLKNLEASFRTSATIRLAALNPAVWIGQEIALLAEVKDARGKPLVDSAVTFVTTWGLLRGRSGMRAVTGNSVTLRTDHLGMCTLHLAAALGEALTDVQHASLSAALNVLGDGGDGPRDRLSALTELARRYRAPGNDALRRAVDVYYQRYASPESALAPVDSLAGWPSIAVTVLAYLTPDTNAATAQPPTTLLCVQQRNWFYAWILAYRQLLQKDSSLLASLGDVSGTERSSSGIMTDLFGRVRTFMRTQDGMVGQRVGQDFAEARLNDFLQQDLARFPAQQRIALLGGVTAGAKSLAGGSKLFSALEGSRASLSTRIDAGLASVDSSVLAGQLAQFQAEVSATLATKADAVQIDTLSQQVLQLQKQNRSVNTRLAAVNTRLKGVDSSIAELDTRLRGPQ